MTALIRFWRSLTKKDSVKSARYEIEHFFYFNSSFSTFFSQIRIFGRSGTGLRKKSLIRIRTQKKKSDPDPDSEKNL